VNPRLVHKIEVPLYAYPVDLLLYVMRSFHVAVSIFGGYPDSPFNGGRNNFLLDGKAPPQFEGECYSKAFIEGVRSEFWDMIDEANRNGIPFFLTFSNMFCDPTELTPTNLEPIERLVQSGNRYKISNGVIINNAFLEQKIRHKYSGQLIFISSCTKYVLPDRLLSIQESIDWFLKDSSQYDYVVITPQLSRNKLALSQLAQECPEKFIAIANTYCSTLCNSYHHYEFTSRQNKIPLHLLRMQDEMVKASEIFAPHMEHCSAVKQINSDMRLQDKVRMQLEAGIRHFKIGRGIGQYCLEELAELIQEYDHDFRLQGM
jgi:hypothetical protein